MKLYQIAGCPFAWRTRILLGEKQLPFDTVFFTPDARPPELDAISADAKSPTLVDGDVKLWESLVINEYLEDRYPERSLLGTDPAARAQVRAAVVNVDKQLMPRYMALMGETFFKPPGQHDQAAIEKVRAKWREGLATYDSKLAGRRFLVGDSLSLGDVMLFTPIPTVRRLTGEELPAGLDHLRAWMERMEARPAWRPVAA